MLPHPKHPKYSTEFPPLSDSRARSNPRQIALQVPCWAFVPNMGEHDPQEGEGVGIV